MILVIGAKTFVTSKVMLKADPDYLLANMLRLTCPMRPAGHIYFLIEIRHISGSFLIILEMGSFRQYDSPT